MGNNVLQQAKAALYDAYFGGKSLTRLVELLAELMGNPVVVVDMGYRILASSGTEELNDAYWLQYIQQGFCSYEYIAMVNTLASVREGRKDTSAYRVYCELSDNYKLVCGFSGSGSCGNIILFESRRAFTLDDYTMLEDVSRMIAHKLGTGKGYRSTREIIGEDILYDLLEERCNSVQEMEASAKQAGVRRMDAPHLLVFDLSEYRPTADTGDLKQQLQHRWNLLPCLLYNNCTIVTICDGSRLSGLLPEMEQFCRENSIYLGVSRKIKDPLRVRPHYLDALKVIQAGKAAYLGRCAYCYHEVACFLALPSMAPEQAREQFSYPELDLLMDHDAAYQTDFLQTFYTYMVNGCNVQKTAADLYIHRNTVRYRINQIARIAGIDFEDASHLNDLFLACRILWYLLNLGTTPQVDDDEQNTM